MSAKVSKTAVLETQSLKILTL